MKKLFISIILISCLILSGCNYNTKNVVSNSQTGSNTITFDETVEAISDHTDFDITETTDPINGEEIAFHAVSSDKVEYVDTDNIKAEQYISQTEIRNNPFYPVGFYGSDIYVLSEYYTLASKDNHDLEINRVKKFNLKNKEVADIASYEFAIGYDPDLYFEDHYFTFPCVYDEKGKLTISVTMANTVTGDYKIIYKENVSSPYYYADILNENEIVFLVFSSVEGENCQKVLKYNFKDDELTCIFENYYQGTEKNNLWSLRAYKEKVFLLGTRLIDNHREWNMTIIDAFGTEIDQHVILGLRDYDMPECNVNQFCVTDDSYLFQFYDSGTKIPFIGIDRKTTQKIEKIKFNKLIPLRQISPFLINNRYYIYDTYPDYADFDAPVYSADICIYDTVNSSFDFVKINYDDNFKTSKILSNEKGDILLALLKETGELEFALVNNILSHVGMSI